MSAPVRMTDPGQRRTWKVEREHDEHGNSRVRLAVISGVTGVRHEIVPSRSQIARNHSPDGFEFGYGGSGPAQLALAIMLDYCEDKIGGSDLALELYQDFKWRHVSPEKGDSFEITEDQISDFVAEAMQR